MNWKMLFLIIIGLIPYNFSLHSQSHCVSTVTLKNRNHHDLFGGWGPHLRSILRTSTGEQWMAIDDGPDDDHNDLIRYYRLNIDQKTWVRIGQSSTVPFEIRQNMAHIMVGNVIHSYAVDLVGLQSGGSVHSNRIVQVKYDTQTNTYTRGYITLNGSIDIGGSGSNYIGASVNGKNGLEVVWWRRRLTTNPPAEFMFIWKYPHQQQWNGPITQDILVNGNAYSMFQYVYGTFVGNHRLELVGQSGRYNVPNSTDLFVPAHQTIDFTPSTATPQGFTWLGNNATAANRVMDVWKNPCTDDLHVMAYNASTGDAVYYYRPDGSTTWTDWQFIGRMTDRYDTKFSYDTYLDTLAIVNYDGKYIYSSKLRVSELTGSIDLNNLVIDTISIAELQSNGSSGLYVQRPAMQTDSITRFQFAMVGKAFAHDSIIRYIKYDHVDLTDTVNNVCQPPACPDLTPVVTVVPTNLSGVSSVGLAVELFQLAENKTDGSVISVRIPVDPRFTFTWDPGLSNVGFTPVNNADWVYTGSNSLFHTFGYAGILGPNHKSAFGVIGSYDPQNTEGSTTVTVTVVPGGGNECEFTNNSDSEIITYFD